MSEASIIDDCGRDSRLFDRYTAALAVALCSDEYLQEARDEWITFMRSCHGAVFDGPSATHDQYGALDGATDRRSPADRAFIETCYYDFVIDSLLGLVERRFDIEVTNPEAAANTDALTLSFGSIHARVAVYDAETTIDDSSFALSDIGPPDTTSTDTRPTDIASTDTRPTDIASTGTAPTDIASTGTAPTGTNANTADDQHSSIFEHAAVVLDPIDLHAANVSLLRTLYETIVSTGLRRQLGQYYTPRWVADLAVSQLDMVDVTRDRFLDPGCGSGVFLAACINAKLSTILDTDSTAGSVPSDQPIADVSSSLDTDLESPAAFNAAAAAPDTDDCFASIAATADSDSRTSIDVTTIVETITGTVYGIDLNPVAVRSAKLAYLLALSPVLGTAELERIELPVFLTDALGIIRDDEIRFGGEPFEITVEHLVGNPPWITWSDLTPAVKAAWQTAATDHLELFPHGGQNARLGHANDDVSVPFVRVSLDRYLTTDGDAAMVLKRGLMLGPAGQSFRNGRLRERPVSIGPIHDLSSVQAFGDAVNVNAAVYALTVDEAQSFPVSVHVWDRDQSGGADERSRVAADGSPQVAADGSPRVAADQDIRNSAEHSVAVGSGDRLRASPSHLTIRETTAVEPIDPAEHSSSWIRVDADERARGECSHEIRHGVKDDATAVYTVDDDLLDRIEHDHVYPYLRSKHIVKYGLFGHDRHLVPVPKAGADNEGTLSATCPKTYAYLESQRDALNSRSSTWLQNGTFYDVFGVGTYTWAPYKVVWCRLGFKPHFVVVSTVTDSMLGEKPIIPGDHCMFIPTDDPDEAQYLCALLNSEPYQRALASMTDGGKAGLSKHVVSELQLPPYTGSYREKRLVDLSKTAHEIVPQHTDVSKRTYNATTIDELAGVQAEIDALVSQLLAA